VAQLMPLPLPNFCSSKSRLVLLSVLAHPGSPRQSPGGHKMVAVVVVTTFKIAIISGVKIIDSILEMEQDRDIVTVED